MDSVNRIKQLDGITDLLRVRMAQGYRNQIILGDFNQDVSELGDLKDSFYGSNERLETHWRGYVIFLIVRTFTDHILHSNYLQATFIELIHNGASDHVALMTDFELDDLNLNSSQDDLIELNIFK